MMHFGQRLTKAKRKGQFRIGEVAQYLPPAPFAQGQRLIPLLGIVLLLLAALWLVHPAWLLAGSGV